MSNIGIMGGTFDPIHNGHLRLAKQAYLQYHLDSVWFMPSGQPPHKKDHKVTDADMRCQMVQMAIAEYPYFCCSDFEVRRQGNTYTAQTLALLKETYPEHTFYFIVGADSLYEIENWYHPELVMKQTILLAAGRSYQKSHRPMEEQIHYLEEKYGAIIKRLDCKEIDVSSAEIREIAANGHSFASLVPPVVGNYIRTHHLYKCVQKEAGI
ncbi:MAG: nicotinate-nucleotide adenylyltransferase [Lachnospiraceae bacterium]|jgi:nicotinate-nucleotide adenylyltransferase